MKLLTLIQTAALLIIAGASVFAGTAEHATLVLP
jgi:hypothetical protein